MVINLRFIYLHDFHQSCHCLKQGRGQPKATFKSMLICLACDRAQNHRQSSNLTLTSENRQIARGKYGHFISLAFEFLPLKGPQNWTQLWTWNTRKQKRDPAWWIKHFKECYQFVALEALMSTQTVDGPILSSASTAGPQGLCHFQHSLGNISPVGIFSPLSPMLVLFSC